MEKCLYKMLLVVLNLVSRWRTAQRLVTFSCLLFLCDPCSVTRAQKLRQSSISDPHDKTLPHTCSGVSLCWRAGVAGEQKQDHSEDLLAWSILDYKLWKRLVSLSSHTWLIYPRWREDESRVMDSSQTAAGETEQTASEGGEAVSKHETILHIRTFVGVLVFECSIR